MYEQNLNNAHAEFLFLNKCVKCKDGFGTLHYDVARTYPRLIEFLFIFRVPFIKDVST